MRTVFFPHNKLRQTIAKNTAWLMTGETVSRLIKLAIVVFLARSLGPAEYGSFAFALSFVSLFVLIADAGLSSIITKRHAQEKFSREQVAAIIGLKSLLSFVAFVIITLVSLTVPDPSGMIRPLVLVLGAFTVMQNFADTFTAFFRSVQKMNYEAMVQIVQAVAMAGFVALFFAMRPTALSASLGYIVGMFLALAAALWIFHRRIEKASITIRSSLWVALLKESWPLVFIAFFSAIYNIVDIVIMGYMGQVVAVGWYEAAVKICVIAILPSALLVRSAFPALSMAATEPDRLRQVWTKLLSSVILFIIPLAAGGLLVAKDLMLAVYGVEYLGGAGALQVLIVAFGLSAMITACIFFHIAINRQKTVFHISLIGALTNLVLNLILIPQFSLHAAASTTLFTMLMMFCGHLYSMRKNNVEVQRNMVYTSVGTAILATGIMVVVLVTATFLRLPVFVAIVVGTISYVLGAYVLQRTVFPAYAIFK